VIDHFVQRPPTVAAPDRHRPGADGQIHGTAPRSAELERPCCCGGAREASPPTPSVRRAVPTRVWRCSGLQALPAARAPAR
jgi:hypothetical protein